MPFGVINFIGVDDFTIWSNHHPDTGWLFLVYGFRRPIGHCNRLFCIAKQLTRQTNLIAPFPQIFRRTECNPQNDGIFIGKVLGSITEPVDLLCSIVAKCARIKPQNNMLPGVVRQANILPVLIGQSEARRHASDLR